MTSRASSPRRLQSQNSVKKQENGMDSPVRPGRQPLRAIPEASSSRSSSASEHTETSSPSKPPTPRGKKRAAAVYRQSENVDGNISSASNTPEKPREKRTTLTRVSKSTAPWPSKLPITASLARALQDSQQQTDAANKSWDSDSVGGTPTTSYRTPLIPSTGAGKSGSIEQTSRTFKISGKPPLDSELSRTCFGSSNSSFLQSTPSRSVNRSLRYGATPGSAASVGSSRASGNGAKSSGSFQFNTGQQISTQQFDLEEDNTFWEDHNVQVILRTRPINASESALKGFSRCLRQENSHSITWIGQPETRFTFDHVAGEHITQENLFRVAGVPMVENCMAGYNSCMFCYGQTGSGKTHTMLGDIVDLEHRPSADRGITPRVFEYLFSKIQKEEESRTDEHLKYVCKCSFLEIFNEQITDLLEPSSTNLQVREGGKKGVYVENLSEVAVGSVQDVVRLLLLGAANRKVAATNMNRESSRSHSVFTCTIESKWELNSATNIRFGRLNLVDLAGSERQKTSGAEGERLKEAANINKSLSTLGLVIMILVDVANGKQRHVPYRDSKLTYLLQDSLGGNSKTTMIANISPSSCCALETLSTLKFAQRAKFIRNNAVVNEDASGDMNGLRQEIQELKEELDRIRRQDLPRTPSMHSVALVAQDSLRTGDNNLGMAVIAVDEQEHSRCSLDAWEFSKAFSGPRFSNKKLEAMEAVLAGALRREQEAELSQKRQSTEIDQLTRLVKQREDDSQCSKMLLRFREDKIRRLEALSAGSMSADVYLRQENDFLMNELRLIQEKADRNPELTRFAMENIRLLEQLRRFQDFYTGGEREAMADEISSLRDQLLEALDSKLSLTALTTPQREALAPELAASQREIELLRIETDNYRREVEDCRKNLSSILEANSRITKQLDESNAELREVKSKNQVHQVELQKLREQALDAEAIEWGHAQHLELISNLKIKLQQSEDRADREATLRFDLNEHLNASLGEAADLHADLQETRGALDAAEMLVCRLQSAESDLSVAQELAILAQNAVRQIHLETKEIAEDQRLYLKHTEDAVVAACMKELELREELKQAQSLIQKLSSRKDEPMCCSCSVASENEPEPDILVSKTVGICQLEPDLKSLDLLVGSGCTHLNTRSRKSAEEEIKNIAKLCDETSTTQRKQSSYQEQGKDCILKLNFTLEESHTVEDRALLEVEPDETRMDLKDADSIVSDRKGDRDHYVLKGNDLNPEDLEVVQAIRCLQGEIMKLKPQCTSDQPRETATKLSSTELVKELQGLVLVVQAVLEERKNLAAQNEALLKENDNASKAREERDTATLKLLEHLNEGEHALTDAVHEMQGILDDCLSQPTALDKGRLLEQESINVQQLDMTTPTARKDTDKIGHSGGNDHSDDIMRNFAVCTIMLQWFSDTLTAESSAKDSLRTQNDRAEEDLGNKDCIIKEKDEVIAVLQRDWTELESKAVKTQEKLRASNLLFKELARSEEELKLQTVTLAAENKRLTRCMACREMEFSSLQGQIEGLEKSLKESHEKERITTMTLGNLKESFKVLEKQWHVEKEQMKDRIVTADRELSESQEKNQIFYNALKELEGEIIATEKKSQVTFSELETHWSIARGEMSSHLTQISLDFIEVKSSAEMTYLDLAKARSLLSDADIAIEQLVDKSSELKDTNNQLLVKQEALESELSCWEQCSVELQKSSCFVRSPCKDSNAIANSGVSPIYNYFETLKTEVEKVRRECERLRAEVFDKDTTLLSVQLELSATIASSREGEIEMASLVDERSDLKQQLTSISEALANAQDEVRCRDVELKTFECELHKVMDVLARTEEKMDESALEWRKQFEKLKAEMEDAKLCASEKSTEAIMLRKQFEDGQATVKEAEMLVNALVRANEIAKRDVLKWKSRGEKITVHSNEVLSMIDEEVSVTMDHVEKHLQDLSSDIHGVKTLLTGICSERAAGFDHEFKEFMKIQISEIESATDGAHMKLAKMSSKVTELEQTVQRSVMENEALQVSLDRTQDLLVGSQAALDDAMQKMGVQYREHATTKNELQGALASLAGKSAYISELTFECDHLSTRNQELERLFTESCEELRINVANSKELEMEKLTLIEATEMLQVENNHLRGQVKQLEISLVDAMRMKQVVEMEVNSLRQQKDSYKDEIRKFEVDLAASHDAVNAAAAKLLETEVTIHALISDLENSHNEVVCIQGSLDEAFTEVNDLRLLTHELGEKEVYLMAQAELQKNLLESTSEKFVQSEVEFHEALDILATMLESTSSELHAAETSKSDLEKNNIKFSSLLASLQVTASQLGQEKGFLSVRVSDLEEDKKILLERLEFQSKQLCMQSLEASAASSAQELQLEILKTIIESTSREVQEKGHMIFVLEEKLEQSSARYLALDENKNDLVERLEIERLELCKLSQEATAASTAYQTELQILKTMKESASWELQEKDHMIFLLQEKLEQSSVRCLTLDENKKDLAERLEIQTLELCKQSQEASAACTAHETELEILKTIMERTSWELQEKDEMMMSLREKLERSSARCLALDEDNKNLLECLEMQSLELCKLSEDASAASTAYQTELEILKTTIGNELQEKDEMMMSHREKLEESTALCLALDEDKNDLVEQLKIQSLELCKQSQEASAARTAYQTELEILKTIMESTSRELQEKDEMMMSLREKLDQSRARCLALDDNNKDLVERLEIQRLELCKLSEDASAASTAYHTELEILKTTIGNELQKKDEMMMSLRVKLEESTALCLALDEDKNDLVERLEIQTLELCKQSQEASAACTAHQTELEILKTTMESALGELQEKDEMMMSLREKLDQSSARCVALDENNKDLVERLEIQSLELCKLSEEASAASTAYQTELEILKTTIGNELREKDEVMMSLREKLEENTALCLTLDEDKNDLVEQLKIQSLELCKQSQEASAARTAHQTELEILKTIMESTSRKLQEKDEMMMSLREKLDQSRARCLALDDNNKDLLERLEIQTLDLCKQSQEAGAELTARQAELEKLKTTMESALGELQEKDAMMMSLREKLDQSSGRSLALDEIKKDLLERLEIQNIEFCKQSQEAGIAYTAHQTELEIFKTIMESSSWELQEKDEVLMSLREKLNQSCARCLTLDEDKNDLVEQLKIQSLELCKQSQEASAARTAHQTELEIFKTIMERTSWELQEKDEMMMSLREKLDQSSARCLALDEDKKDLLERLEIQTLDLCKQSQEAGAELTARQAELEKLKTTMESALGELQEKDAMMMSLREKLDQSSGRSLALDENKKDLLERLEIQSLELCKQSQEASAACTAHQTELEIFKTIMESTSRELQENDEMMMSLREKIDQSSALCLALDENKKDLLERLEMQSLELCKQSQEASAAYTAHPIELEILRTIIDSASNELLEKDHITSSLLDNLQKSSAETLKLLNSLEISMVASAQMELERDEVLATANNLETEKRVLRDEVMMKSRSCTDLEMKILRLQTEVQESSSASWKLKLELEILTAMLECAVQESREKDAMASDLENLLSQSQLQNAEMLQSSQEVVNHFSLFQSQLDDCFQQNKELERNKLVLTAEVYSLSQEIADIKELRQASERCLEEFKTSFAQLGKQKDEEVRLLSDEVEMLKSQEAAMEMDLWDWEQRCQDTEVQLDEKVSELMVLRGKLVATQEESKQQLELVYEALRECQRRTEEMDIERRDLINEIEEGCSVVADLQAKLQIRESEMEEHFSRHSIEQEALESLENEKSELESIVKHLTAEVVANQQRATAAENMQVETRLEMEALERDLKQKDDLLQNLESDLNLLQESAFQELRLNQELDSLRVSTDVLQQEVIMQKERRTRLEIDIGQVTEEIVQTRNQAGTWKAKAYELETELDKKRQAIESLEDELRMAEQNMTNTLEEVTVDLKEVENERDRLQIEVLELTEQLEMTHTMVEERDAVISELHQAGELSRTHAKEKEDEAKLLTRSVHELESTVYALENQLGLLKREAERQRLLREDIEMESQKLNNHIFVTQSALEESNTRNAEELKHAISALQETERKVEDKESEISHFRRKLENLEIASKDKDVQINDAMAQISDLLLAAEVQKSDYQQKLKRMESQVERSKTVNWEVQSGYIIPNSIEVATEIVSSDANPAQESFSRRDITHFSCQSRINELEELAFSRQKEVFTLHTRLAEAESMTHDVLRDLLGVKSELNNVVSMLDHQQIKKLAETACRKNVEAEEMETELSSLRSQLNAYIEERESWIEEIKLRQCESVTARVAAENLRQKEQVLTEEIEKFRIENINHQEKISELEMEIRRLPSSQQSFYQQINHHAKIKEENQALKLANEELSKELRRTELLHAGMHDELVRYKSVEPKSTSPSFDEERLNLRHLLQEAENSRAEAAQKLSSLCSALMQAAGLSVSETVDVPGAMDALDLLENRLRTTEPELSDSKYKIKFTGERRRRTDVRAKDSPLRSISNFTDLLQRASSGSPAPR